MTIERAGSRTYRRLSRRKLLQMGAVGAAGFLALPSLGCGSTQTNQPAKGGSPQKEPKRGGTINVVATFVPQGMDPHRNSGQTMGDIEDFMYGNALRFAPSLTSYDVEPDLVESWEQPDNVTYILHVRKGVKWHNIPPVNGRELTAEDIKYSFERIATPKTEFQQRWMFAEVVKTEATDKYTVKMSMKRGFVPMLYYLATRSNRIVAREAVEAKGDLEDSFIGTGPFIMDSFNRNVGAKLKKNPDYYVSGRPYLDAVTVPIVTDASAILAALRSRELDHASVTFSASEALKKNPGDLQIARVPGFNQDMLLGTNLRVNHTKPPFTDARVRKALRLGADRQKLIDAVADGKGIPGGIIASYIKNWALPDAEVSKYLTYDPQQAKKLLAEAGFANGFKFTCNASTGRKGLVDTAVALKEQYKTIGLDLEVNVMEHSAYIASQVARNYETLMGATYVEDPDPDFLYNGLHTKGPRQFSNFSNPKLDELLEKQRGMFNAEERKQVFYEIQRLALEDGPEVSLLIADGFITWQSYFQGYQLGLDRSFRRCFEYWVDK